MGSRRNPAVMDGDHTPFLMYYPCPLQSNGWFPGGTLRSWMGALPIYFSCLTHVISHIFRIPFHLFSLSEAFYRVENGFHEEPCSHGWGPWSSHEETVEAHEMKSFCKVEDGFQEEPGGHGWEPFPIYFPYISHTISHSISYSSRLGNSHFLFQIIYK